MTEPIHIRITSDSDLDGQTAISLRRSDLQTENQLRYTAHVQAGAGVVPADFFGLLAPYASKVVGVASTRHNPRSVARVLSEAGRVRQQVNLTTELQYVLLHAGDRLAIGTQDRDAARVDLVVNELSEADHMRWALGHGPTYKHTRLRIVRRGAAFTADFTAGPWEPAFEWDDAGNMLTALDQIGTGPIPISALCPYPRHFGCFVAVRFAGSDGHAQVFVVDALTRSHSAPVPVMPDVTWSQVQYLSHDDHLVLQAQPMGPGLLVCDIEVVRVEPKDRLRGRYAAGS